MLSLSRAGNPVNASKKFFARIGRIYHRKERFHPQIATSDERHIVTASPQSEGTESKPWSRELHATPVSSKVIGRKVNQ
jgi:hypothetical protein